MAIMTESEELIKIPKTPEIQAQIAPSNYKHSLVDSKIQPVDSLLTHIGGMSWTVDYYSQVIGADEEPKEFQRVDTAHQQYLHVHRYELKLQGSLNTSHDTAQNRMTTTGSALMYPKLIPNFGDVILADIGDGKIGRFTVTNSTQKSMFNNRCYEIEFSLANILTKEEKELLEARVVKNAYFVEDYIQYGQDPMLVEEEFQLFNKLTDAIDDTLGSWLAEFYSHEINTIRVPSHSGQYVYDPFVVSLITKIFTSYDNPLMSQLATYNCDSYTLSSNTDIWSAILSGEEWQLKMCFQQYQITDTSRFLHNVNLRNIKHSRVDYVVLPVLVDDGINTPTCVTRFRGMNKFISDPELTEEKKQQLADLGISSPDISTMDTYVVSKAVYDLDNETTVSPVEQELRNYFEQESINPKVILKYVDNRRILTKLQRFYLMPICLLMMTHLLRKI